MFRTGYIWVILLGAFQIQIQVEAQGLIEVYDYRPAPGQFINRAGTGTPGDAFSLEAETGGLVSLGGFGGYITIRFTQPLFNEETNPYGVDFVIFGNAATEFSEPAAVMVSRDDNSNNIPDDPWYELAGSDYFFSSTVHEYKISYAEPGQEEEKISWVDNLGGSGYIVKNSFYTQNYYPSEGFDLEFYTGGCSFSGTRIQGFTDASDPYYIRSYPRKFGYADNRPVKDRYNPDPDNPYTPEIEGMGGDAMDISWAVDTAGRYVDLDRIDFLRIYTCAPGDFGPIGELSSEITMIRDVYANPAVSGKESLLVAEELPALISPGKYQLRAHYFISGRHQDTENVRWEVLEGAAEITDGHVLVVNETGEIWIMAELDDLVDFIETKVTSSNTSSKNAEIEPGIQVYPVPFDEKLTVSGMGIRSVTIYDTKGNARFIKLDCADFQELILKDLEPGLYFIRITTDKGVENRRIVRTCC